MQAGERSRVDLHCHSTASLDRLAAGYNRALETTLASDERPIGKRAA